MIRRNFLFDRPLTPDEIKILDFEVLWRRHTAPLLDNGQTVGCYAHPDDVRELQNELKARGRTLRVTQKEEI